MRLFWKGKLTKDKGFPKIEMPEDSIAFLGEKSSSYIAEIIGVLLFGLVIFKAKQKLMPGLMFTTRGLWLGMGLAVLSLIIHELIHGLACPKDCSVNYYYSIYGITAYPLSAMTRNRYIFVALAPATILGFLPMVLWTMIPARFIMSNSIIFSFSWISLSTSVADIHNAIRALKLPQNSMIQASEAKVYWFFKL